MKELVVVAIVEKGWDRILIVKRMVREHRLTWVFPGGKKEPGENEKSAVTREVFEETGIHCTPIKRLGVRVHPDSKKRVSYWSCRFLKGRIRKSHEIAKAIWARPAKIKNLITSDLFEPVKSHLGIK